MPELGTEENNDNNNETRTKALSETLSSCTEDTTPEVPLGRAPKTASHGAVVRGDPARNEWCVAGLTASCCSGNPDQ